MGKDERANRNGNAERFQSVRTLQPKQEAQRQPVAIPGYVNLGADAEGMQEILFVPICRRIQIIPPAETKFDRRAPLNIKIANERRELVNAAIVNNEVPIECEGEDVRILIEDGEWMTLTGDQAKQFLRRIGARREDKEPSLIVVPDIAAISPGGLGR